MGVSLADASGELNLETGHVYSSQVKGRWVEIRVLGVIDERSGHLDEQDMMLDAWVELPLPAPAVAVAAGFGPLPPQGQATRHIEIVRSLPPAPTLRCRQTLSQPPLARNRKTPEVNCP
jgi:hypothetical protein